MKYYHFEERFLIPLLCGQVLGHAFLAPLDDAINGKFGF